MTTPEILIGIVSAVGSFLTVWMGLEKARDGRYMRAVSDLQIEREARQIERERARWPDPLPVAGGNCSNCGAPLRGRECAYCNSVAIEKVPLSLFGGSTTSEIEVDQDLTPLMGGKADAVVAGRNYAGLRNAYYRDMEARAERMKYTQHTVPSFEEWAMQHPERLA